MNTYVMSSGAEAIMAENLLREKGYTLLGNYSAESNKIVVAGQVCMFSSVNPGGTTEALADLITLVSQNQSTELEACAQGEEEVTEIEASTTVVTFSDVNKGDILVDRNGRRRKVLYKKANREGSGTKSFIIVSVPGVDNSNLGDEGMTERVLYRESFNEKARENEWKKA